MTSGSLTATLCGRSCSPLFTEEQRGGRLKVASRSSSRARINVQDVLTPKSQLLESPLTWNNVVANTALLLLYSLDHQWLRDTGGWAVTV